MRRWPGVLAGYVIWAVLATAAYFAFPGARPATAAVAGLSSVAAIIAGVAIHRPARRAPWLLLATANLALLTGQVAFGVLAGSHHQHVGIPSALDVVYLLSCPLSAAGLLLFIPWRAVSRDRRSLLDALTLAAGLGLPAWLYLVLPYARNPDLTWDQKTFAITFPLMGIVILAALAQLLALGFLRSRPVQLLAAGTAGLLVSDTAYAVIRLHGSYHAGTAADLGWGVLYVAWGAAALHPAMAEVTRPAPRHPPETSAFRLVLLMLASLVAPAVLVVQSVQGRTTDAEVIAVFSALVYLLVLYRLADVAASHRRALHRERVLRMAGASLGSAITLAEIASAVRAAVATLSSQQEPWHTVLAVREGSRLRTDGYPPGGPASPPGTVPSTAVDAWLPVSGGTLPYFAPASLLSQDPAVGAAGRSAGDSPARDTPGGNADADNGPAAATRGGGGAPDSGAGSALVCPLALRHRPAGVAVAGALAFVGDSRALAPLSGTLETLAGQAALAVDRVMLSEQVSQRHSQAYFRTLVHDMSDIILITEDTGLIRYATPSAAGLFGEVETEGACLGDLLQPAEREEILHSFRRMRERPGQGRLEDWRITRPDGTAVQVQVRISDHRRDPTVGGLVLTLRDVTQQRELERELTHQAFHDSLTGLPNRVLFSDRITQALARARRDDTTVGVMLLDLDDFKVVNDSMGHGIGDELLAEAARRLAALVRHSDTAARLGGDEFALLVEGMRDSSGVESFAERAVNAFGEPFALTTGPVIATATVGVATTEDSGDAGDLIRHADLALYAAKAAGKRQWRRYQPVLSVGMTKRRELQAMIGDAVAGAAFTLVYQPIVRLATGEVAGFEALLRWPHPHWGMIHPDQFISIAEETGHIVPLGAWVMEQAVAEITRWQQEVPRDSPLYVSVNVSARQFANPGFVAGVERVVSSSGLATPSSLVLELTESVLLRRDDRIRADLNGLKQVGVRLAIDDFGTGYSSLGYLRELPIDVLKVDKSFVEDIAVSQQRLAVVDVIVQIARTLGLTVMAEGIESEVQRSLLVSLGCEYGQGYLLERPLAAQEARALVHAGSVPALRATSQ